jgi:predicted RNA binding protein YcfA (HicA-like mRNA interferase family)
MEKPSRDSMLYRAVILSHLSSAAAKLNFDVPRKVRELIRDLLDAGFREIPGGGKGSHRKFTHSRYPGAVTLSGGSGDDAKHYQEKQIRKAIERVQL